jgi:hypothetical protein
MQLNLAHPRGRRWPNTRRQEDLWEREERDGEEDVDGEEDKNQGYVLLHIFISIKGVGLKWHNLTSLGC